MNILLRRVLAFAILASTLAEPASSAAPTKSEVQALLASGEFAVLDKRLGEIQRAYAAGTASDEDLRAAFRAFYFTDAAFESPFAAWIKASPKSYAAHLGRGIYYKYVGNERRGTDWASKTTDEQFAGMREAHEIAAQELTTSLKLDKKPILSYLHLIDIANNSGDRDEMQRLYAKALAIDPRTFIVREKYLGTLQTRWGGSLEEMTAFVESARSAGLTQTQMARLNAIVREEEGWLHETRGGDLTAAAESYRAAALLDPDRACVECGPWYKRAFILQKQGDYLGAIAAIEPVLKSHPDNRDALDLRAFCTLKLGMISQRAIADLTHSAELGSAWAQLELGKLYIYGAPIVPTNRDLAKKWLFLAASQGKEEAMQLEVQNDEARARDDVATAALAKKREASDAAALRDCDVCRHVLSAATQASERYDYKTAITLYSEVLSKKPTVIGALNGRGLARMQLGERKLAAEDFRGSAVLGDAQGQTELAMTLFSLSPRVRPGDNDEAIEWIEKAVAQGYLPAKDLLNQIKVASAKPDQR